MSRSKIQSEKGYYCQGCAKPYPETHRWHFWRGIRFHSKDCIALGKQNITHLPQDLDPRVIKRAIVGGLSSLGLSKIKSTQIKTFNLGKHLDITVKVIISL